MSFTSETKKEITNSSHSRTCCDMATLATLYAILSEKNRDKITLKTESAAIARKIIILTKNISALTQNLCIAKKLGKLLKLLFQIKKI